MAAKKSKASKKGEKVAEVTIAPLNIQHARFEIEGTTPYVQSRFPHSAEEAIKAKHKAGSTAKKNLKKKPRDFGKLYEESQHRMADGSNGIPATAFRNAMIDACRFAEFAMVTAKGCLFIIADGFDPRDGTPLISFTRGTPSKLESKTRIQKTMNIAVRAIWQPGWRAEVLVEYDADMFTLSDVTNLMHRAGIQVGVGEGRPLSKASNGMGWGRFRLVTENESDSKAA